MKEEIKLPFSPDFTTKWELWKEYRRLEHKFKYKSPISQQAALLKLVRISQGQEQIAVQIIMQSIENGWSGLFELKNNQNGKQQRPSGSSAATRESVNDVYNAKFGGGKQNGAQSGNKTL